MSIRLNATIKFIGRNSLQHRRILTRTLSDDAKTPSPPSLAGFVAEEKLKARSQTNKQTKSDQKRPFNVKPATQKRRKEKKKKSRWRLETMRLKPQTSNSPARLVESKLEASDDANKMHDLPPPTEQRPVAQLAHGLDRVLFNPGVSWLQDPRTRVLNFSSNLQTVPKVEDFAFQRIGGFTKSSADDDLFELAKQHKCKYTGSTSSLTGMLSHIYLMLFREPPLDLSTLSAAYRYARKGFNPATKFAASTKLVYRDGVYSTDSHPLTPGSPELNVLTWMGTMLEKFFTLSAEEFKKLLRSSAPTASHDDGKRDAYRYAQFGDYVMRSQLDCYDPRLPGTGVFDIKTRAALPIRLDILNYEHNSGYLIKSNHGLEESFEREYYDLIRSAFLKYSFQARIGNMDGVFVTYHNTARVFGFQYIPLEEMDTRLYGNKDAGPFVFEKCLELLQAINNEIIHHLPQQNVQCLWEANPVKGYLMVWVQPADSGDSANTPIIQLKIDALHYLDGKKVPSHKVLPKLGESSWSVRYRIKTSSASQDEIRKRYEAAVKRQEFFYWLPDGLDLERMAVLWRQIDYGGRGPNESPFNPELFKKPSKRIRYLRSLAQEGRKQTQLLEQQDGAQTQNIEQ